MIGSHCSGVIAAPSQERSVAVVRKHEEAEYLFVSGKKEERFPFLLPQS
jgi:hypothetical protein